MPATAYQHFIDDIDRAESLIDHGADLTNTTAPQRLLQSDIFRSGWMFGVGALDAYLCDAYSWVVGGTLIAKDRQPGVDLPGKLMQISLPVSAYLGDYAMRDRWRWRMAAIRMMDDRNMLNLGAVETAFKPFLPNGHKLYHDVIVDWVEAASSKKRLFAVTPTEFGGLTAHQRVGQRQHFIDAMRERFEGVIFQRRHDCIHNCDRPRTAPQRLAGAGTVRNVLRDVTFFAEHFDAHLENYFPAFLQGLGFSAATIQAATH